MLILSVTSGVRWIGTVPIGKGALALGSEHHGISPFSPPTKKLKSSHILLVCSLSRTTGSNYYHPTYLDKNALDRSRVPRDPRVFKLQTSMGGWIVGERMISQKLVTVSIIVKA
jgi:hypothetical protein